MAKQHNSVAASHMKHQSGENLRSYEEYRRRRRRIMAQRGKILANALAVSIVA